MAPADQSSSELADFTRSNRATYDRIARRYADRQLQLAPEATSAYAALERGFVAGLPRGGVVGDLGCGPAFDGLRFAEMGFQVAGVDLSAGMLRIAQGHLEGHVAQGDLRALPLATGCLDGIWNVASMLHVPERETPTVLHEFRRVLKPLGSLVLVTALGEGAAHEPVPNVADERRWYVYRSRRSLVEQLNDVGFVIEMEQEVQSNRQWWSVLASSA